MKRITLILWLLLSTTIWTFAYDFKSGDLCYNITSDSTVEVTYQADWSSDNYSGLTTAVIPESVTYNGTTYSVTSIGEYAFFGCSGLTSIEWNAKNCADFTSSSTPFDNNAITSFVFGDGVQHIPAYICNGMNNLTSITIPSSVTSVGEYAFNGCTGLNKTNYTGDIAGWLNITGWGYTPIGGTIRPIIYSRNFFINDVLVTDLVIPEGIDIINDAFSYDTCLISVTIPNSVTSIGWSAFMYCSSLTSVTIGNSVTSIENYAFEYCSGLTSIEWNAKNCADFTSRSTPFDNNAITSFVFGDSVQHIPAYICNGMNNLTSVTIGNSVTSIGEYAFSGCRGLTSVVWNAKNYADFTNNATPFYSKRYPYDYSEDDFDLRSQITSFTFGDSVQHIPAYICNGMDNLASVTIGNSVTSIGDGVFKGCSDLMSVVWNARNYANCSSGYTPFYRTGSSYGNYDLDLRSQITSFVFGDSVQHIPAYICDRMNNLASVTIGNSVTSIGARAFSGCIGLTSVTIPNSVTSIGAEAFMGTPWFANMQDGVIYMGRVLYTYKGDMPQGTNIIVKNGIVSITEGAFSECHGLTSMIISDSVMSIGDYAFENCNSLTSITIPQDVMRIGRTSFRGCTSLTHVKWNALDYTATNPFYCESVDDATGFDLRKQITSFVCGDSVYAITPNIFAQMTNLDTLIAPTIIWNFKDVDVENLSKKLKYVKLLNGEFTETIQSILSGSRKTIRTLDLGSVSNTEIPDEAFREFYKMDTLVLPAQLTKIPYKAVSECVALQSIVVPEGVTEIEYGAFSGCSGLQTLILPSTLQSIADNGFASCSALKEMRVHAQTPPTVYANTFSGVKRTIPVYVPQSAYNDYTAAEVWKEFLIQGISDAVENTSADTRNQDVRKVFRDGQIYILRGNKTYTLTGEEVR